MFKVVIDTNQFVSSIITKKGPSAQLLQAWRNHYFILILSKNIIGEIKRVLYYPHIQKKYNLQEQDIESLINLIEREAIILSDSIKIKVINDDPDDNKFLACALEAEADYIISGDKHLLNLHYYKDIPIITVREFLGIIEYRDQKSS
ncbi:MAG: putative toxin-antitoxin system toxin component, PIN family [bacterium]